MGFGIPVAHVTDARLVRVLPKPRPVVPKESKKQRAPRMDRNAREATLERAQRLSLNQLVKDEEVMALPCRPLERILRKAHVPREVDAAAEAHAGLKQAARKRAPAARLVEPFASLLENTFNAAGAVRQLGLEETLDVLESVISKWWPALTTPGAASSGEAGGRSGMQHHAPPHMAKGAPRPGSVFGVRR